MNIHMHLSYVFIILPIFCLSFRSLTRSIIRPGTALLGGTSAATSPTRQSILFIFIWAKWPSYSSSLADHFLVGIEGVFPPGT